MCPMGIRLVSKARFLQRKAPHLISRNLLKPTGRLSGVTTLAEWLLASGHDRPDVRPVLEPPLARQRFISTRHAPWPWSAEKPCRIFFLTWPDLDTEILSPDVSVCAATDALWVLYQSGPDGQEIDYPALHTPTVVVAVRIGVDGSSGFCSH